MKTQKTFFILPGFRMQTTDKPFLWLKKFLKEKGFNVIGVPVAWNNSTITKNSDDFKQFYNKNKGAENYILGFSYGAVIAFMTANELKPKKIFLCSLSPDFIEDKKFMHKSDIRYIGKRRYEDTLKRSAIKIAKDLSVPVIIFYGEKEAKKYPELKTRANDTARYATNSKIVVVKDSPHQIDFPEYIDAIKRAILEIL